jgi:hypothetical protein
MLSDHATFPDGGYSTEAIIVEMQQRMADGRFRIASDLSDYWQEYASFHRDENGQLVKVRDDLLSASMKALMMRRYAKPVPIGSLRRRPAPTIDRGPPRTDFDLITGQPLPR